METQLQTEAMIPFMYIAIVVALFLFNSGRIQKAIEIWNECLILLNKTDQNSKGQFTSPLLLIYKATYIALFRAYRSISYLHQCGKIRHETACLTQRDW